MDDHSGGFFNNKNYLIFKKKIKSFIIQFKYYYIRIIKLNNNFYLKQ